MKQRLPYAAPGACQSKLPKTHRHPLSGQENKLTPGKFWEQLGDDQGQGISEYTVLLVLLVLMVVAVVHALGTNAQQVIDRVNTALHG
jgi:Flp pilus assembly pilin Flp